jgi:preprotein translocase subunit SecG
MFYYLVTTLYVFVCLVLLGVILLQQGKGGDMASAFGGGGSQTAFGARAGATVLTKATAVLGALFMIGAIGLGIMGQRGPGSLMRGLGAPASAPVAPPAQTPAQTTTPAPAQTTPAPKAGTPEAPAAKTPATPEKPAPEQPKK